MGKGRGWHGDIARHSNASKKGWRNKSHDYLAPRLSSRKAGKMQTQLRKLQKELDVLRKAKKRDSKTYERKLDRAWELYSKLDKHGML